jgi:hypothetical protein
MLPSAASIYSDALPPLAGMPASAVAFRAAGGFKDDTDMVIRPRVEVRTYAKTDHDAALIWWTVYKLLHNATNIIVNTKNTPADTATPARILSIQFDGGPSALIDPTLNTPFKLGYANLWCQLGDP